MWASRSHLKNNRDTKLFQVITPPQQILGYYPTAPLQAPPYISDHYPISKGAPRLPMKECKCNCLYFRSYPFHCQVRENPHHAGLEKPLEEPVVKGLLCNLVPDKQPKLDGLITQVGSHPGVPHCVSVQYCNHWAVISRPDQWGVVLSQI